MAEITTKIRAKTSGNITDVLVLIDHPMETGLRSDPKNKEKKIPAHYIQKLGISLNGKEVASTDLGAAVSKDPLIGIKLKGTKAGDKIKVTWSDNKGQSGGGETTLG
jgi:sulfur-oxidizing protein SoxZ